ncbi:MAG: aldehyde dehydrogenase family protein [Actinobacteria bacterium]|nr:MAG: aldehyde dehydrogenase family protein [Actinomycetota bacterium]
MAISVLPKRDELGVKRGQLYIDGTWCDASDGGTWTHVNPAANEEIATFAIGTAADIDRAVAAARRAFDEGPWPRMKARERKALMQKLVGLVYEHKDELGELQVLDNAIPVAFNTMYQVGPQIAADIFDHHAGWIDKIMGDTIPPYTGNELMTLTFREPVGVVAAIIPWNAPLFLFAQKVAPALATGCTVVVKPSEYAALAILRLTEVFEEVGLPPGVLNVVPGPGQTTGEALVTHPGIDKISFTGSRAVGQHILSVSGDGLKRVSLELGGKSASVNFADAPDVGLAAMTAMGMVSMGMSGQGCVIQSRALVQKEVYDDFINAAAALVPMVRYGDPFSYETTSGPIINPRQLERVMGYIESGRVSGARLVVGGDRPAGDLAAGNYVNPTLFADVDNQWAIAREEIFGPVLSVMPFTDEDEAVRIANDSPYGLGGGVYTSDIKKAFRVARALRAGTIGINEFAVAPNAPFGGFKTSGLGREGGWPAIEAFTELKTVFVGLS